MELLLTVIVFFFGACIGSFLNCAVFRMEEGKKMSGRSFCPKCRHKLGFFDLIPIFSFIFLKRKCRYCQEKISWQYLVVEIATGMIFSIIFNYQLSIFNEFSLPAQAGISQFSSLIYLWIISSILIVVFIYDLKH